MESQVEPIQIIHFDSPELLKDCDRRDFNADLKYYDVVNGLLPILITWRMRLYNGEFHRFSYLAETRAVIKKGSNVTREELEQLVLNMKLEYDIYWQEQTNSYLFSSQFASVPGLSQEQRDWFVNQILDLLR